MRARGSDGHQNVLSLIGNSHMLENRWEQKARCLQNNTSEQAKMWNCIGSELVFRLEFGFSC